MRRLLFLMALTTGLTALALFALGGVASAQQKKEMHMGPYFETLKGGDSVDASIDRGRKLFNDIGCAGCHPRGGTIGGTALDVAGNRNPIPIPDLRGAALHFPRVGGSGFVATIGIMNDL